MKRIIPILLLVLPLTASAQTVSDGLMMPQHVLCTGFVFTRDSWTDYWEGELKRDNDNIGRLTTQSLMWMGSYGVNERVNVIAMLPYVWTQASQGTMHSMEGVQDLSLAVKYNFLRRGFEGSRFNAFGALAFSTPVGDYTPDYFPLALGTHTHNLSGRLTAYFRLDQGWYVNGTAAYTLRSNTTLDRPAYYTNGQLYLSNEVEMHDVFDVTGSLGYFKDGLQAELHFTQQNTLGGSDIRRQDMPFVSNRMNSSRLGALVMYHLPVLPNLAVRGAASIAVAGRNVGASTALTGGLFYTLHFSSPAGR
jgi:hypothetical protein